MEQLLRKIESALWSPRVDELGIAASTAVRFVRFVYAIVRDVLTTNITLRAMGLVYVTILSIVPMLALSFSALKGFGVHQSMVKPALLSAFEPLGEQGIEITERLISYVDNVQGGLLAGAGLVLLIYTTISMIKKTEDSLNYIWRVDNARSFMQRVGEYLSVVVIGPLLMITAIGLIATIGSNALVDRMLGSELLGATTVLAGKLMPYILVSMVFSIMYWFIPNTRVGPKAALAGGFTGGILWAFSGVLFATFVVSSSRNVTIYASFAIVIIALMWLYISWVIFLIGAQTSFYFQNPGYLRVGYRQLNVGNKLREQAALGLMLIVAESFRQPGKSYTTNEIGAQLGIPGMLLTPIKIRLINAGLLETARHDKLIPSRDPSLISLAEVFAAVRDPHDDDMLRVHRWPGKVDRVFAELGALTSGPLYNTSLYELLDAEPTGLDIRSRGKS